jgi:hypothetical protein
MRAQVIGNEWHRIGMVGVVQLAQGRGGPRGSGPSPRASRGLAACSAAATRGARGRPAG